LEAHFRMRVAVLGPDGGVRAANRDLRALQRELGGGDPPAPPGGAQWTRTGLTRWDFGDLPDTVRVPQRPHDLTLTPVLLDAEGRVDLKLVPPGPAAVAQHRAGVRRLLLKNLPQQTVLVRA